jgi:hypothetical protein
MAASVFNALLLAWLGYGIGYLSISHQSALLMLVILLLWMILPYASQRIGLMAGYFIHPSLVASSYFFPAMADLNGTLLVFVSVLMLCIPFFVIASHRLGWVFGMIVLMFTNAKSLSVFNLLGVF